MPNGKQSIIDLLSDKSVTVGELLDVITKRYNVDVYEASWILFREWFWGRVRFAPRAGTSPFLTADATG